MNRSTSNEDRTRQHLALFEKRRQTLANLGLSRGQRDVDNVGDGRQEERPLTPFGRLRPRCRRTHLFDERQASDSDGDVDDTLSEFAAGYYEPRWRPGPPSKMRPSTLKKLNHLFDTIGSPPLACTPRGHSAPEVTDGEEERPSMPGTPAEEPQQKGPVETAPNESSETPKLAVAVAEPIAPVQPTDRASHSSTVGLWCLRKLMTVLLLLFELMLKLTIKVLEYVRGQLQTALHTLWDRYMFPLLYQGFRERLPEFNPKSIGLMIVIAPLLALLAVAYCVVCALYWLNRVLLMETHLPWLPEVLPDPHQHRSSQEKE